MNKLIVATLILFLGASCVLAQKPWKMQLTSKQEGINLAIDLYEESIKVPGMEMFGPQNGYMDGNIYGVWTITSFAIKNDKKANIKISNDLGSETQSVSLTMLNDSVCALKFEGRNCVKRVSGKKLVSIPSEIKMTKAK